MSTPAQALSYCCPVSGELLSWRPLSDAATLSDGRALPVGSTHLLSSGDGRSVYPVIDGFPQLLEDAALRAPTENRLPPSRLAEVNDEVGMYDGIALSELSDVESAARRMLGAALLARFRGRSSGPSLDDFPEPLALWVDSNGSSDTGYEAYRFLAPLGGRVFLQFGGSGSHAIKALLGGARLVALLSPSQGELRLGRAVAAHLGLGDRFIGIRGVGERIPLATESIDRIYGGGCLHHTDIRESVPELSRVLARGGRASFVDPRVNPIYGTWGKLFGGLRFCGAEEDAHDHPLVEAELEKLGRGAGVEMSFYASGGPLRYGVVLLDRAARIHVPPSITNRIFRAERSLLARAHLSGLFGNMAVMMSRR